MIYIIGAGGVGSWLAPAMCKLVGPSHVVIVDGDKLEEKNLDRQLFSTDEIGEFKSDALARKYGCKSVPEWYSHGSIEVRSEDDSAKSLAAPSTSAISAGASRSIQ